MEKIYNIGKEFCDNFVENIPVEEIPPKNMFTYHHGVLFLGMEKMYSITKDERYYDYLKNWVDLHVQEDGTIEERGWATLDTLDFRQAAVLLFGLYERTKDEKYKKAIIPMVESINEYPKNSKGGFWHMKWCENQMWLDGLYMMSPLLCMYAEKFDKPQYFDMAANQAILMYENIRDENGLLRHGWDESKKAAWADKETGLCSVVWSRACGWVLVALTDMLDVFPKTHPKRSKLIEIFNDLLADVVRYQDKTGLWYQVMDKGNEKDNWLESSASCLFVYAMSKGIRMGYIDKDKYLKNVEKAVDGLLNECISYKDGKPVLSNICAGFCIAATYDEYVHKAEVIDNDLHGIGPFIQMSTEVYKLNELIGR